MDWNYQFFNVVLVGVHFEININKTSINEQPLIAKQFDEDNSILLSLMYQHILSNVWPTLNKFIILNDLIHV